MKSDLSSEALRLLREARSDFSPDAARLAALRLRIATHIADGSGSSVDADSATSAVNAPPASTALPHVSVAVSTSSSGAWATLGIGHVVGAAMLAGALAAAGLAYWQARPAARPNASIASVPAISAPAIHALDENASESSANSELPRAALSPTATLPELASPPHGTSASRSTSRGRAKVDNTPSAAPTVAPAAPSAPPATSDSLADEIRLLRAARSALDHGDASQALGVLRQHQQQFPRGTLYEERLATQVQALCLVDRVDAARGVASELERAAPHSPHLARVRASCVGQPAPR